MKCRFGSLDELGRIDGGHGALRPNHMDQVAGKDVFRRSSRKSPNRWPCRLVPVRSGENRGARAKPLSRQAKAVGGTDDVASFEALPARPCFSYDLSRRELESDRRALIQFERRIGPIRILCRRPMRCARPCFRVICQIATIGDAESAANYIAPRLRSPSRIALEERLARAIWRSALRSTTPSSNAAEANEPFTRPRRSLRRDDAGLRLRPDRGPSMPRCAAGIRATRIMIRTGHSRSTRSYARAFRSAGLIALYCAGFIQSDRLYGARARTQPQPCQRPTFAGSAMRG